MNKQELQTKNSFVQIFLVTLVIVLFPLVSFIMNLKGRQTGRTFYDTLKNKYGLFPSFSNTGWHDDKLSSENFLGNVVVVSFVSKESREEVINTIQPIVKTDQFREEIDNLTFLTFDLTQDSTFYSDFNQKMNSKDHEMWKILRGGDSLFTQMKLPNAYTVSLVDTANTIRCYYDVRKPEDRKLLVEHISVMPIHRKANIEKKEQKNF